MARIGIGIDTGGTYTDAVAFDFDSGKILGKAKSLTTRHDLSLGITRAMDALPAHCLAEPVIISLSTTLATNACVENRMGRAKLVFFGGDAGYIDAQGARYGLPPAKDMLVEPCQSTYSGGSPGDVDWERFLASVDGELDSLDGVGVIEMYSMRNGAVIEKKAKALLGERTGIPVVCGHELASDLDSLRRGASTLVNASLFPTIHAFILAIKQALEKRGIDAPVVIVRSDGNLMGEEFASLRPAETLLCGPAASVMGAMELAKVNDCVVVDMGGTTSDIAVVRDGEPIKAETGIGIDRWQTFIRGLYIKTFGLGGDSALHCVDGGLVLEDYRVAPLCMVAAKHPGLLGRLEQQLAEYPRHTRYLHEGFVLVREPGEGARYDDFEKRFCALLRDGPLLLRDAALAVGRDEYTLDVSRLVREGVVQVFGLTPTDIMHVRGDFSRYSAEASLLGVRFVAAGLGVGVEELCELAYGEVRKKLFLNVVAALLEHENPEYKRAGNEGVVMALAADFWRRAATGCGRGFVDIGFRTELPLVGIGAPIHVFLGDVAAMLGTTAIVPENSEVANALGAVVGRIHARSEIAIRANYNTEGINGYTVFGVSETRLFSDREEAERFAIAEAKGEALAEARRRGATGEVAVNLSMEEHKGDTRAGVIYLGTRAVAEAVGSVSF